MTQIQFTKMHGLGNDFMVIDATRQPNRASKAILPTIVYCMVYSRYILLKYDSVIITCTTGNRKTMNDLLVICCR